MRTKLQTLRLLTVSTASLVAALLPVKTMAADSKPDIVLIVAEDTNDAAAPRSDAATPNLAALKKTGATFSNAYSTSSEPGPSNAGLLTGRYPQRLGFDASADGDAAPADHGKRGLDPAQATLAQELKAEGYVTGALGNWYLGSSDGYGPAQRGFDEAATPGDGAAFIDHHAADPFFLYLPVTGTDAQVDEAVGSITARLAAHNLDGNSLVIFVNDKHASHWTLSDRGIRSPIVVSWKGKISPDQVIHDPVSDIDIAPTVLAAAGVALKPEWHVEGNNLLPFLEGEVHTVAPETLYWRLGVQYAVRDGDWKLVKSSASGYPELFYLQDDAVENLDLFKQQGQRAKELQGLWDAWNAGNEPPRWADARWNGEAIGQGGGEAGGSSGQTSASGPWKSGDSLSRKQAPDVAQKAFEISADIDATGTEGVIVTQGGTAQGYAIYLTDGKPAFAVREAGDLTTIVANDPIGKGHFTITVALSADGTLALSVNGKQVAAGKAAGLIRQQPKAGFVVGKAGFGAVGDYETPDPFDGNITNVRIRFIAAN